MTSRNGVTARPPSRGAGGAFDVLYAEGADHPKMMSLGLHMRLMGRPGRAAALARFLDHVARHDRVWICRRIDIARHWMTHHPFRARP